MKKNILKTANSKFILLLVLSTLIFSGQLLYSQNINERKLTIKERKVARQKNLVPIEMKLLLEKGYSLEKIKNTPTDELKKVTSIKVFDIKEAYKKCNQERNLLIQREKELKIQIEKLKQKNKELELKNKELQEKLKAESN